MAAPTTPYCASTDVASLLIVKLDGATDFSASSRPTKTQVQSTILVVDSQIEMRFGMAGYKLPFAILSGETWPTHQTYYLKFLSMIGTAAIAGGYSLKPAPALSPSQVGGSGNVFQDLFTAELDSIYRVAGQMASQRSGVKFRAQYYPGTLAEKNLLAPRGATTDFMEGYFDPERHYDNWAIADKLLAIQHSMKDLELNWDYLYGIFDIDKGFGVSNYE